MDWRINRLSHVAKEVKKVQRSCGTEGFAVRLYIMRDGKSRG
jgi:hypothetical protein